MSNVQFKRGDNTLLSNTPVTDGLLFFNSSDKKIYMDDGEVRKVCVGATKTISNSTSSSTLTTPSCAVYENNYVKSDKLITNVRNIYSASRDSVVTSSLLNNSVIGTDDISSIGTDIVNAVNNLSYMAAINTLWTNSNPFTLLQEDGFTVNINTPIKYRCFAITYATKPYDDNSWQIYTTIPLGVTTSSEFILDASITNGDVHSSVAGSKVRFEYNNLGTILTVTFESNFVGYSPIKIYGVARYA